MYVQSYNEDVHSRTTLYNINRQQDAGLFNGSIVLSCCVTHSFAYGVQRQNKYTLHRKTRVHYSCFI